MKSGENEFFNDIIHYIKIPHHSSDGSKEMFNLLSNVRKISNSVSTVYRNSGLPKQKIMQQYKRKQSNVFCTGNINESKNQEEYKYGIVKHTFDIINNTVEVELVANANEI